MVRTRLRRRWSSFHVLGALFADEPFFMCQNLHDHDPHLWLVDSGASRTVVSAQALKVYRVLRERDMTTPINFRTTSGEQVAIERECMLEVFFPTMIEHEDGEKVKIVRYEIRAVIGQVEHNLLSVHGLTRMGATFTFGPNSCSIQIADIRRMSCEIWANALRHLGLSLLLSNTLTFG